MQKLGAKIRPKKTSIIQKGVKNSGRPECQWSRWTLTSMQTQCSVQLQVRMPNGVPANPEARQKKKFEISERKRQRWNGGQTARADTGRKEKDVSLIWSSAC
jgi:hypothetical protein